MDNVISNSYLNNIVKTFIKDPWSFVTTLTIIIVPMLIISAFLSYKLAKKIEINAKKERAHQKLIETVKASANGNPTNSKSTRRSRAKRE